MASFIIAFTVIIDILVMDILELCFIALGVMVIASSLVIVVTTSS
jgi:hypothetical protein